jgi:hypothetical protein
VNQEGLKKLLKRIYECCEDMNEQINKDLPEMLDTMKENKETVEEMAE